MWQLIVNSWRRARGLEFSPWFCARREECGSSAAANGRVGKAHGTGAGGGVLARTALSSLAASSQAKTRLGADVCTPSAREEPRGVCVTCRLVASGLTNYPSFLSMMLSPLEPHSMLVPHRK